MPLWGMVLIQILVTVLTVTLVLSVFWALVIRPYLDKKAEELIAASKEIEPGVTRGVKTAVAETFRELPESAFDGTVRESTRQFLKFGSGLFENGLSSFLGTAGDMQNRPGAGSRGSDKG